MTSYTSTTRSPWRWTRERWAQLMHARRTLAHLPNVVAASIEGIRQNVELMENRLGIELKGQRVLEVGYGQLPWRLAYLASIGNTVCGVDVDFVPSGLDVRGYYRLWRRRGLGRATKTLGNELLGARRAFRREFCRQLDLRAWPDLELLEMDVSAMTFPDDRFDFVCSWEVFEHVEDPQRAVQEIARVLRPRGVAALSFVHYAWYNALHDLRLITESDDTFPLWAHLRESTRDRVQQGAYVNRLRIDDWRALFSSQWPGCRLETSRVEGPRFITELTSARQAGELTDWEDDELLTDRVTVYWVKPVRTHTSSRCDEDRVERQHPTVRSVVENGSMSAI